MAAGDKFYAGVPCHHHPEAQRYTSNGQCVACVREDNRVASNERAKKRAIQRIAKDTALLARLEAETQQ